MEHPSRQSGRKVIGLLLTGYLTLAAAAPRGQDRLLEIGKRLYRDGQLSSGEPVTALINGDTPVLGSHFSCVSCHQRSGLGSIEG